MKNTKNIAVIVAALAMTIVMMVPVFATNPFASSVEDPKNIDAPVENGEHAHVWEMFGQGNNTFQTICEGCQTFVSIDSENLICEHQFANEADPISGKCVTRCTKCRYNIQRDHSWEWSIDNDSHVESCTVCGFERTAEEQHTFETVFNEDGHAEGCTVCGFERNYAEHNLVVEFDAYSHWEHCTECGYETATVEHTVSDAFCGDYHYTECACGYTASMHYGATYHQADEKNCLVVCDSCELELYQSHDWNEFKCHNCDIELPGTLVEMIKSIDSYDVKNIIGTEEFNIFFIISYEENEDGTYMGHFLIPERTIIYNFNSEEIVGIDSLKIGTTFILKECQSDNRTYVIVF